MVIEGPSELKGSHVHASRDHRLAMMLALAGLVAGGETVVEGWEWTQISYPGFEKVLSELGSGRSHE
jgi:3-phosphoshikimate 1-carboxyvinyltransferase